MTRLLLATILALTVSLGFNHLAFAACGGGPLIFFCNANPPNPDPTGIQEVGNASDLTVNVTPGAAVDTILANGGNGGDGIRTGSGNDQITVNDADISGESSCIDASSGNNVINVSDSDLFSVENDCLDVSSGDDTINVTNSNVTSDGLEAITTSSGNDTVNVTGSVLRSNLNDTIGTSGDDDTVTLETSTLIAIPDATFDPLDLSSGNDTVTFGNEVVLVNGLIDCGPDFDTLIFTMDVPEEAVGAISSQILQAGLPDGFITINGLFYEWIDCELLVPQLNGVRELRPIPTLSEWGLIAMAGVLGIIGLIALSRKQARA